MLTADETCDCVLPSTTSSPWTTVMIVAVFVAAIVVGAVLARRRSARGDRGAGDAEGAQGPEGDEADVAATGGHPADEVSQQPGP